MSKSKTKQPYPQHFSDTLRTVVGICGNGFKHKAHPWNVRSADWMMNMFQNTAVKYVEKSTAWEKRFIII